MTSPSPPSLLTCPACERVTPLPPQIATHAVVRCPHCRAQFSLRELLIQPTIAWELVGDHELPETGHARGVPPIESRPDKAFVHSCTTSQFRSEAEALADNYTYVEPTEGRSEPVSPGAKTIEMPGYQTFVEQWRNDKPEEELFEPVAEVLFDSNRAASDSRGMPQSDQHANLRMDQESGVTMEGDSPEPPRKLEGPLVGEFLDDPPSSQLEAEQLDENKWDSSKGKFQPRFLGHDATDQPPRAGISYPPRIRRTRRSPIWSMFQVVLGGLAAVPISLLLMWHLLGTDIGEAAPWVAKYAPWIVPEKFRPYAPSPSSNTSSLPASTTEGYPSQRRPSASIEGTEIPSIQPQTLAEPILSLDESEENGGGIDVPPRQPPTTIDVQSGTTDALDDGLNEIGNSTIASAAESQADSANPDRAAANADLPFVESGAIGPETLEPAALNELLALIRQTNDHLVEWPKVYSAKPESDKSQTRRAQLAQLARSTYSELTSLAMMIDRLPTNQAVLQSVQKQLEPIGQQVEKNSEVRVLIRSGAAFWMKSQSQSEIPANLAGTDASVTNRLDSNSTEEALKADFQPYGFAMTVVVDWVVESENGQWTQVIATADPQLGTPPVEIRIPRELTTLQSNDTLAKGQSLFLLGTVRPASEEPGNSSGQAPKAKPFVASYLRLL